MKPTTGSRMNPLLILPISQKNIVFTVPSCRGSPCHRASPAVHESRGCSGRGSREERVRGDSKSSSPVGLLATCAQSSFLAPFTAPFISSSSASSSSPSASAAVAETTPTACLGVPSSHPHTATSSTPHSLSPSPMHRHHQQRRYSDIAGVTASHVQSLYRAVAGSPTITSASTVGVGASSDAVESPKHHRASFSSVSTS